VRPRSALSLFLAVLMPAAILGEQAPPAQPVPQFRSSVSLVLVDVVVRDRAGAPVKGLTADDFEILEDGVRQQIQTFAFEEITSKAASIDTASTLSGGSIRGPAPTTATAGGSERPGGDVVPAHPLTSSEVAGHRLMTLLFDTSSMQPDEVQKAVDSAAEWVDSRMSSADLVAVAAINSRLQVITDFTTSRERVQSALAALSGTDGTAFSAVDATTMTTDEQAQAATSDAESVDQSAQELDTFNNDVRLRALRTLAEALQPIQQKKAIIYFSSGMERSGTDNQVELRGAVNAALRANAAIYPVDVRGLQTVIAGGSARQASSGGLGTFTGSAMNNQFTHLAAQQETLTSLASDTGGTAFTDTNDFGEAFARVERDISSYYILGFASTNTRKDGRFRRLTVRIRNHASVKLEATEGYYAERDFAHTGKTDREALLQEQLATPIPATDVPVYVTAGWFKTAEDKYYVPVAVAVAGGAVTQSPDKTTVDLAGFIKDERGVQVGRIRDTLTVPPSSAGALASRQLVYQTGLTLPPGHFSVKIAVRENGDGRMGTFEMPIIVPDLRRNAMQVSSVLVGTQLKPVPNTRTTNPLVRDGVELVPNLTRIFGRDQALYFQYEVYDPTVKTGSLELRTSLAFYRGKIRVFETPMVERTHLDAVDRHAAVFQFEVPPGSLTAGLYTCQVNIIDAVANRFAFPRLQIYVR
jgi:VWFA-related protein